LSERANFPLTIYQLATVSIQLIGKKKEYYWNYSIWFQLVFLFKGGINYEALFKLQSRKQNETIFSKLTEIFLIYK
jgi:hypothetical protein